MSSIAPTLSSRRVFEDRLAELSRDVESLIAEAHVQERCRFADELNQAARRIRQAEDVEQLSAALVDSAARFAAGVALFRIEGETARGERIRGLAGEPAEQFRELEIPLAAAAALAGAVETRDPVTAAATPGEVSARLIAMLGHQPEDRVSIFPVVLRDSVPALLYTWGEPQGPAIELLTQIAAPAWQRLTAPPPPEPLEAPPGELVRIAPAAPPEPPPVPQPPPSAWDRLTPEEQQIHFRAQRVARVRVAEMRLTQPEAVLSGRTRRDLYTALRKRIDAGREEFRKSFFAVCPSMVDYFHLELVGTLANEDAELLGPEYPGPMV
jgi:hypothetical protein